MNRLKKWFMLLGVMILAIVPVGCLSAGSSETGKEMNPSSEKSADKESEGRTAEETIPELGQIKNICELATLECYYHNVAKSVKESGTGVLHLGEKERPFWMEYTGVAQISFELDQVKMEQHGKEIIITLPRPQITCRVEPDSWNEDSYVISEDQWIQKNPITAEDQTQAIEEAQAYMQEKVENNSALLYNAEAQAKYLITNYIDQIGQAAGVDYHIIWEDKAAAGEMEAQEE